jgi:hypothetical protein
MQNQALLCFTSGGNLAVNLALDNGWLGFDARISTILANFYNPYVPLIATCRLRQSSSLSGLHLTKRELGKDLLDPILVYADEGLKALRHVATPAPDTLSRLLLISGRLQRLVLTCQNEISIPAAFNRVQDTLSRALTASFKNVHDHRLMAEAACELVLLYGSKYIKGQEEQHKQLSCHYLKLVSQLKKQASQLVNGIAQLSSAPLVAIDKLASNIKLEIVESSASKEPQGGVVLKGDNEITAYHLLRYRNSVSKELRLPFSAFASSYYLDILLKAHTYLCENYSSYSAQCILKEPFVPAQLDPKLSADYVLVQWYRDYPAVVGSSSPQEGERENRLAMIYILGGDTPVLNLRVFKTSDVSDVRRLCGSLRIKMQMLLREGKQESELTNDFKLSIEQITITLREANGGNKSLPSDFKGISSTMANIRLLEQLWNIETGLEAPQLEINTWLKQAMT